MKVRLTPQILKKVKDLRQYRIILSADTASEVRQMLSQMIWMQDMRHMQRQKHLCLIML